MRAAAAPAASIACLSLLALASPRAAAQTGVAADVSPPAPNPAAGVSPPEPKAAADAYHQPLWTTAVPFTQSQVYVQPEGTINLQATGNFESYNDPDNNADYYEQQLALGLAHRLELDVGVDEQYTFDPAGNKKIYDLQGYALTLRYALADWGEIFGNPTLALGYHPVKNNPERLNAHVYLGDDLVKNVHWAINAGYDTDLWGLKRNDQPEREIPVTAGISTTAFCDKLAVGFEVKDLWSDTRSTRGHFYDEVDIGPSLQLRPWDGVHIDLAPFAGVTKVSPKTETWVIIGVTI